ncbi:MAG: Glycyl-tRNA synthetase beta subunit [Deferribacteraceae bacterium]|jgi:glycyl-tRNA synthetase beta chain|nr:Glycyl-tRNA synthetase beta subunit [Deferribacteraceae bacterium]
MSFYLLEIGTEEIPAGLLKPAYTFLKEEFERLFKQNNINFTQIISNGTPRRLFVYIDGLPEKQSDRDEIIIGPPASIAFDESGKLTKVALGFAKSKGIDEADLSKVSTDKGEYLQGVKRIKGISTSEFILNHIEEIVLKVPFKKSMRWGNKNIRFARPIHWFLSIFDGRVLPFEIDGIKASNISYGHRFMAKDSFAVTDFDSYIDSLKKMYVFATFEDRKNEILNQIKNIEKDKGFVVPVDKELLDTVANLVEYPYAVIGSFSDEFLKLPQEVLVTSMKVHQKYFYILDDAGNILNYFIGISNTKPVNDNIRNGYERVLRARLTDAIFFYENDKNVPLEERANELKKVVYQEKLGTSWEKVERFTKIAEKITLDVDKSKLNTVKRACQLCKADLMTEMVYEFPELQGYMGMIYARLQGEDENVALAINEHYMPRFAGDNLPTTFEGSVVSIADKIDTICGCFAIGLIPTGNNDPYALRRGAIGILNILREKKIAINIVELIRFALEQLTQKANFNVEELTLKVYEFIIQRFKQILVGEGVDPEVFESVSDNYSSILKIEKAAKEISPKRNSEDFMTVAASYKRIANILKKADYSNIDYKESLFTTSYEKRLAELLTSTKKQIEIMIENEDFGTAMNELLNMRSAIDEFFDNVMVMDKDENIKNNRLGLLASLKVTFDKLLKFEKIN